MQSSLNKQECEAVLDKLLEWKAVPVSCLNKVKRELKNPEQCNKFLSDFSKSPLRELLDARALVSEDMWAGYKWMQMNGLQEQVIFYAARKKMNDWFKARYPRPEKTNGTGGTNSDGAGCGSVGIGQPDGTVGAASSSNSEKLATAVS